MSVMSAADSLEAHIHWSLAALLVVSSFALVYTFLLSPSRATGSKFWSSQPWVGEKKQWFSLARATFKSIRESKSMVAEGYAKFSKLDIPFVHPTMASGPVLVIPPSQLHSILDKPESEIDPSGPQNELLQLPYLIGDREIWENNFQFNVVRKQLTRNLSRLTQDLAEELALCLEHYWGTSTDWTTVRVFDSCLRIVARALNRVVIGIPLCRNEEFLEHSMKYSMSVFGGATILRIMPSFLRPIAGPVIALMGKRHLVICKKLCVPFVEERLRNYHRKHIKPNFMWAAPNDALQWIIDESRKTGDPKQLDAERLTHRLLVLNLAAIHATGMATTNIILDLYSSSPSEGFVDGIREECNRVFTGSGSMWTKDALAKLFRVDSTVRESMRFSDFAIVALPRQVSASQGVILQGNIRIPKGTNLVVPMHNIHHDEAYYSNPTHFDAFRFSRPREAYEAEIESTKTRAATTTVELGDETKSVLDVDRSSSSEGTYQEKHKRLLGLKQQSSFTVGDTFLAFGHSRHACPGRFLASRLMKLMLAHVIQHYDVEYMAERPPSRIILEAKLPSDSATIRVRRRTK